MTEAVVLWLGSRVRLGLVGLATPEVAGFTPGLAFSGNNLGQVVHTHSPLSPVTKQYNLVPVKGR